VTTPHRRRKLWTISGHLGFYRENMYSPMDIDGVDYYIKPMNCPYQILIYKTRMHSYRELPIRMAELGTVYRYERSGVLHGLLRVRGFTIDDAHHLPSPIDGGPRRTTAVSMLTRSVPHSTSTLQRGRTPEGGGQRSAEAGDRRPARRARRRGRTRSTTATAPSTGESHQGEGRSARLAVLDDQFDFNLPSGST
jgi:hypothetical protein